MAHDASVNAADATLRLLIEKQPALVNIGTTNSSSGVHVSAFIKELRAGLIEMYKATPQN